MGKGEIARYKQFLLFLQCFQKACFQGASKGVIVWEWVKHANEDDSSWQQQQHKKKKKNPKKKMLVTSIFLYAQNVL